MFGSSVIRRNIKRAHDTSYNTYMNMDNNVFKNTRDSIKLAMYHLEEALESLSHEEQIRISVALNTTRVIAD